MVPSAPGRQSRPDQPHRGDRDDLRVFTLEAIREVDRLAVSEFGLSGAVLMENAARSVSAEAQRMLEARGSGRRVLIFCGPGNNGGDGLAAARHLHNAGAAVTVALAFEAAQTRLSDEAAMNLRCVERMGIERVEVADADAAARFAAAYGPPPDLVVDALLGTGSRSAPRPPIDAIIDWINDSRAPVLSVDVPSGLDAQSGGASGACVRADVTVALVGAKSGFLETDADPFVGEIVIGDIGCPRELAERLGTRPAAGVRWRRAGAPPGA